MYSTVWKKGRLVKRQLNAARSKKTPLFLFAWFFSLKINFYRDRWNQNTTTVEKERALNPEKPLDQLTTPINTCFWSRVSGYFKMTVKKGTS